MASEQSHAAITSVAVLADQTESATNEPKTTPRLPADVLRIVFDFVTALDDHPLVKQRRLVTLSLVCHDWLELIKPYRTILTLPTASSILSFNIHAPALLSSGITFRHLDYADIKVSPEELCNLMNYLTPTLTSVVMPSSALKSRHIHEIAQKGGCQISRIVVHCGALCSIDDCPPMELSGWPDASALRGLQSLHDLTFYGLSLYDSYQANTFDTIDRLHLHSVKFDEDADMEELIFPIGQSVRHLVLTDVLYSRGHPLKICQLLGKGLISLKVDSLTASARRPWQPNIIAETFFSYLPNLESLDLSGASYLEWTADSSGRAIFTDLAKSLRYCHLGQVSWSLALAFMERMSDSTYLPELRSPLVLSLRSEVWAQNREAIEAYQASLARDPTLSRLRSITFKLSDEMETAPEPYTLL